MGLLLPAAIMGASSFLNNLSQTNYNNKLWKYIMQYADKLEGEMDSDVLPVNEQNRVARIGEGNLLNSAQTMAGKLSKTMDVSQPQILGGLTKSLLRGQQMNRSDLAQQNIDLTSSRNLTYRSLIAQLLSGLPRGTS